MGFGTRNCRKWFWKFYMAFTGIGLAVVIMKGSPQYKDPADNTGPISAKLYYPEHPAAMNPIDNTLREDSQELLERYYDQTYEGPRKRLPQCIIIGAAKCGTEALQFFLQLHPDLAIDIQELNFFALEYLYSLGYDWYRRNQPPSRLDQITVQRGTWFWDAVGVPERIKSMNSSVKLIIVVCEPSRRVVSWYMHKITHSKDRTDVPSFEEQFFRNNKLIRGQRALHSGRYKDFLYRWMNYFNSSQMLIVDGEDLRKNPIPELRRTEDFLGIGHKIRNNSLLYNSRKGFWCKRSTDPESISPYDCLPASKGRRHAPVDENALNKVKQYFKPYNEQFFALVGHKYNWV